ncbi:XrtA system polysaccharide deacetylase [Gemmatimonas phototrophica]|uniref:NodB homology domain-containing protein n=1 Tax=Gemmatimonas phototrophica TaxID=1379270 RepID=A0A143BPM1_9BACT|nr:XrtA system polysaccharide deacetylase [Gemmatimonas phototrophica]AMW06525.1 hypothetical protein GEMMAAP_03530 [Gemmatimonas phototrophica]
MSTSSFVHAFTVDVEEYFHVNAFEPFIDRSAWETFPTRVGIGMDLLLDMLARHNATATFFVLGWVAERQPAILKRIVDGGHEVASHGYWHRRVVTETPQAFALDVRRARDVIEQITGKAVQGYRAPSFSIIRASEWALDILAETGHLYDSSQFPIRRPGYGSPHVALNAHLVNTASGPLMEVPLTVWELLGMRLPASGGGWFRQFPEWVTLAAFRHCAANGRAGNFYIHPWELDAQQPRQPVSLVTSVRHYRGIEETPARLERLLGALQFRSICEVHNALLSQVMGAPRHV